MAQALRPWAADLLHVWFHRLRPRDWWVKNPDIDAMLAKRFGGVLEAMDSQPASGFLGNSRVALAAVLLFDQLPRNLYRDDPRAFAFDPLARAICHGALDRGYHEQLPGQQAQFLAMPLMHSEDIADQERALRIFRFLNGGSNFAFARSHHRMIARFGRFPHRNEVLGRTSTPAEKRAVDSGFAW